ncbi:PHD finger protein MALE MEIOCYTE DEATH 1-like [Zingiber officinale]|uniref:PHD finger protein MALE MEIOCYTE DEATH 1-like n=1 Tax=Zingiber officinale TaxID=94328 RepID=UPI001C4C2B6F|nr:PHD finger protein MALE MEIOCYTE DEATH 1-like [Zingiber officinale]
MLTLKGNPAGKRKARSKVYGLRTFLDPGCPANFYEAFRDNIRHFLRECADVEERTTAGMPTWCTLLVDERCGAVVPLYTVEESAYHSATPFCDYCRCSGWSHHLVSKRRYHLIIPSDNDWDKPLRSDAFFLHNHLFHALLHCNGFGHLIFLNGREGGSKFISGSRIMDLFDRLCTALRIRAVSLEDVSRKGSIDLRLLLSLSHGAPWFARWGYRFLRGSYGVTQEAYDRAIRFLASLDLDDLIKNVADGAQNRELRRIVFAYRNMCLPDRHTPPLVTVRDLLRFLLDLKRRPPQQTPPALKTLPPPLPLPPTPSPLLLPASSSRRSTKKTGRKGCRDFARVAAELQSRWPVRRLHTSAQVVVDALKKHGRRMTRQEVREAARLTIGDTGLLDFVLKSLGDCIVGGHIVRRVSNPATRVLEFSLEEMPSTVVATEPEPEPEPGPEQEQEVVEVARPTWHSARQVERDLAALCRGLLAAQPEAGGIVMHAKHWVKEWELQDDVDDRLRFLVMWMPNPEELQELTRLLAPPEVVVMEATASVGELMEEAETALRDTYCALEGFTAEEMKGVEGEPWEAVLLGGAESGSKIWVRGEGADMNCDLMYEGGPDTWSVGCACGARDDDGERMVACDACDVWHHTRCAGIPDGQPVPPIFYCARCRRSAVAAGDMME